MSRRGLALVHFDWWLLAASLSLAIFGIAMIFSATRGVVDPVIQNRWTAQIAFLVIGIVAFFMGALLDYRLLRLAGWPGYCFLLGVLVLVELFGTEQNLAVRWLSVGNTVVQPTEAGKFVLIVAVAWYLSRYYSEEKRLSVLFLALGALVPPLLLVYRQPDLGMVVTMLFIIGAMILISGVTAAHFLVLSSLALAVLFLAYGTLQDYMIDRINMFLAPDANREAVFNVTQALISVGNGGLFGRGWLEGTQSQLFYLRVRHTDFIFSVVAEEFGFVGSCALLLVFGFLLWRLVRTMELAEDAFGRLLVGGVAALILFQMFVNVGMNIRLMPVTGMTLPLVSSGGSSLVSTMFAIGLTQSVNLRRSVRVDTF
ncbi:MAG: FtsW/RodA/SpoVE family cell cycle protein [Caldilineaceae bacterium]|nr:FtsW/RodA/SpoVE family cell cycle protein [Caldilineaceae bacterium]